MYIVIVAGGQGTRLWPMSRIKSPKQLQKLTSEKSLLRETYERVKPLADSSHLYVSLTQDHYKQMQQELKEVPSQNFITEPIGKNTGPAIGLTTTYLHRLDPEATIVTIASDHRVTKPQAFRNAIQSATKAIQQHPKSIVTIGLKPTKPDTGLGYIKVGQKIAQLGSFGLHRVERFIEKPCLQLASRFFNSGNYLWNASYFVFKASTMLELFKKFQPDTYKSLQKIKNLFGNPELLAQEFHKIQAEPIDTAIIEKAPHVLVIPADLGWSDIGSWATLHEILVKPNDESRLVSRGLHVGINDVNSLVFAESKLVATVGLQNAIVVDTPDVLLVCNKNCTQDIKLLLDEVKKAGHNSYL